ncbi:MAG TPA: 3-deoxy-D-manno-octulosonic acid transferase [Pontiella sp.]|nr:3-deoxy-D-manno-octulosonic acid transferase [Pontiella sp.]
MLPKFIARMLRRGGYGQHFEQRLGHFGTHTTERLREKRRIWVHAVSVGEIYVALRFIKAYREAHPDTYFALSTTTSTGYAIGRKEIDPLDVLFYFPVDLPGVIRKVLRIVNPLRIVLMEGEFWPNLIRLADREGIPVSLVNGRLSKSSYRGYRKLRAFTADILRRINPICVQGDVDAKRLIGIGAPPDNIHIMGTVKFDVAQRDPAGEAVAQEVMRKIRVPEDAVVLLGGSTWPGEETVLCELYKTLRQDHPNLFLVIVPRHVERAAEVMQTLEEQGLSYVRRSRFEDLEDDRRPDVLFIDTTGELRNFYSVADIIFVGKSLTQHGGQNPIEPAMYGKAVIVGPNMENFPSVMAEFMRNDAVVRVADRNALGQTLSQLIEHPEERDALGLRAARTVEKNRGVIERTVELLAGNRIVRSS